MAINRIACGFVRGGGLGKLLEVRAVQYPGPEPSPVKLFPAEPVPQGLDWNVWLNQAAERSFNNAWMNWMRWRDFAGGEMTNWVLMASIRFNGPWGWTRPGRWKCGR